jgi:hypothetical protein
VCRNTCDRMVPDCCFDLFNHSLGFSVAAVVAWSDWSALCVIEIPVDAAFSGGSAVPTGKMRIWTEPRSALRKHGWHADMEAHKYAFVDLFRSAA